jgi:transposase InsO family protein
LLTASASLRCRADESARQRTITVNQFRRTYNPLRPHQALDERTRAAYLAVEHCD